VKILVVGAEGQLGQCLRLSLDANELVMLSHSGLDVTRFEETRASLLCNRPDLVINTSAFNDVDGAESRPDEAYAVNALGPSNLAVATAALGIPLLTVSTDYVFDGATDRPYHEFDVAKPLSVYGASKLAGENAVRSLNFRHFVVRTSWLFWEHGKNFLRSMYMRGHGGELRIANDQHGSPTYVPHLAAAIARLIDSGKYGTYHLAGRGEASRWQLVSELFGLLDITTPIIPVSHRAFSAQAGRPLYSALTTVQNPRIELPAWQHGVAEFASRLDDSDSVR
jgi:dTDP-4-dehydrorhamnose reductase